MRKKRNITKSPIVLEDMARGIGTTTQNRAGTDYTVHLVDVPVTVTTTAELSLLDVEQFKHARVYVSDTIYTDYLYDPNSAEGLPSTGLGTWIPSVGTTGVIVQLSTDPLPSTNGLAQGTNLYFSDTLEEYKLIGDAWVEKGQTGDEVDVTAASHLTLAQAQASDLKEGQYVKLTDYDNELYKLVSLADTGGHYVAYDATYKLKLAKTGGDITLLGAGYTSGDVTPTLHSLFANTSILNIFANGRDVEFQTECTVSRPVTLDFKAARVDNNVSASIVGGVADTVCLNVDARYVKVVLGFWYGNTNLSLAIRSTTNGSDLWIERGFCTNFSGQCIETEGLRTYVEKIATTNSQMNQAALGRGTIRLRGNRSKIDGLTCDGNSGKSVVLDADNCTLENFDIHQCYNTGSIGGIGVYSPYRETKGTVIKDGLVDRAGSHLIKLSGGLRSCKIKDVDLYNNVASVSESFENAMCLLSGTHNVTVEGGTVQFDGTLSSPIDCFQLTVHTNPDTESIGNTIKNVNFLDNPTGQHPRLVNIVGSSGALKAKENTIDGIEGKGYVTLGAWTGDTNNVLQNSKISYDSFATIQANGGEGTKILNNPLIENTRTDSDGHCVRADGGDDFTVEGNTFRSFSVGVRTNKTNTWITRNNFKNPLASESPRTIRCVYLTTGATGFLGGNVYREAPNNVNETLLTVGANDIVGV